jgi:hypothetical protein
LADNISIKQALMHEDLLDLFHLPLSSQAFDEFQIVRKELSNLQANVNYEDSWSLPRTNGCFSSVVIYELFFAHE